MRALLIILPFSLLSCLEFEPKAPPVPYIEVFPATMVLRLNETMTATAVIRENSNVGSAPIVYWLPAGPTYTAVQVDPATGRDVTITAWQIGVDTIRVTTKLTGIDDAFMIVTVTS